MLTWYKNLYLGQNAKKDYRKIIWKVNYNRKQSNIYLITIASNAKNLLDIIESGQLQQDIVRRNCPIIVGLAVGYEEALQLVQKIIEETYQSQKNTDVRKYLKIQ